MAQSINLSIVTTSNFGPLLSQIDALETKLKSVNALTAKNNQFTYADSVKELKALRDSFHGAMMASKGFQATQFTATTSAQLLTKRIAQNILSTTDYKNALRSATKESNLFNLVGQRQVAVQNSNLMVTGKTAIAYTALSVDMTNATIKSQVYTQAILSQKAALTSLATNIVNAGKNMQWAGRQLTAGLSMPASMAAAGAAVMFNTIDKNLTRLAKVYGVGLMEPTVQELANVRKEVLALGADLSKVLGISTNEVTDIAAQFAAAGLTGTQLISATKQASRMVVLGETDKQQAINATISLQTSYKLSTEQLTESVNFFNAAQAATSTSMADLIEAIPKTGPIVRGLGGTYKDMVALLVAMKEGGVPAAEAANAIKNSMGRLINPTKAAQEQLRGFGIDIKRIVTKNAGDLIGMVTELQTSLDKLPSLQRQQAIAELFGKFQFARMTALMDNFNKSGTQSAKIVEMMGLSAGKLAAIADTQTKKIQQSASGQFKIAVESLKNSLLPFGEEMLKVATEIIKVIEKTVKAIEGLPGIIKTILKIGAAIVLLSGPALMITGLFKNLFGNLFAKVFIPILSTVKTLQVGINPLTIIGRKFRELHVEETQASAAAEKYANSMKDVKDINALVVNGIKNQIMMIDELIQRLEVAAAEQLKFSQASKESIETNTVTKAMQKGLHNPETSSSPGTSSTSGSEFSHLESKKRLSEIAKELGYSKKDSDMIKQIAKTPGLYVAGGGEAAHFQRNMNERMPNTIVPYNTSIQQMRSQLESVIKAGSRAEKSYLKMTNEQVRSLFITEQQYTEYAAVTIASQRVIAEAYELSATEGLKLAGSIKTAWLAGGPEVAQLEVKQAAQRLGLSFDELVKEISQEISAAINKAGPGLAAQAGVKTALSLEANEIMRQRAAGASETSIRGSAQVASTVSQQLIVRSSNSKITPTEKRIIQLMIAKGATEQEAIKTTQELIPYEKGLIKSEANLTAIINEDGTITLQLIKANKNLITSTILQGDSAAKAAAANLQQAAAAKQLATEEAAAAEAAAAQAAETARIRDRNLQRSIMGTMGMSMGGMALSTAGGKVAGNAGDMMQSIGNSAALGSMALFIPGYGPAIAAAIVGFAALTKGIDLADEAIGRFHTSIAEALTTSKLEADTLGIKLVDIGNITIPQVSTAAKGVADEIDKLATSIKSLDAGDPLAKFTATLKNLSKNEALIAINQKYLSLKVMGVDDASAQKMVDAILRAIGKSQELGGGVKSLYSQNPNLSVSAAMAKTFKEQAAQQFGKHTLNETRKGLGDKSLGYLADIFGVGAIGTGERLSSPGFENQASVGILNTQAAYMGVRSDVAQANGTLLENSANQQIQNNNLIKEAKIGQDSYFESLNKTQESLKNDKKATAVYAQSVKALYEQLGYTKQFEKAMKTSGFTATDAMKAVSLALAGVGQDMDHLNKKTLKIAVDFYVARTAVQTAIGSFQDEITSSINNKANAPYVEPPDLKAAKKAQHQKIKAQQEVIDQLEKEQKLRNDIADAQKRELDYAKSKADIQGQIQEALASGNVGKAVSLQNDLNAATANYNKELKVASDQRKIDVQKDKLTTMQSQLDLIQQKIDAGASAAQNTVAATGSAASESLNITLTKMTDDIAAAVAKGENITSSSIKGIEDGLVKLGLAPKEAKIQVEALYTTLSTNTSTDWANRFVKDSESIIAPTERAAVLLAFIKNIQNGFGSNDEAMINAIASVTKKSVYIDSKHAYHFGEKPPAPLTWRPHGKSHFSGGHISGPGTGTSDSIPAYLSNGEYVIRASAVKQYGTGFFDNLNTQKFAAGGKVDNHATSMAEAYRYPGFPKPTKQNPQYEPTHFLNRNILHPMLLWADRMMSALSGTNPAMKDNLEELRNISKLSKTDQAKFLAIQTGLDIAGTLPIEKSLSFLGKSALGKTGLLNPTLTVHAASDKAGAGEISNQIMASLYKDAIDIAKTEGRKVPTTYHPSAARSPWLGDVATDLGKAQRNAWEKALIILRKNPKYKNISIEDIVKEAPGGFTNGRDVSDIPSDLVKAANKAYAKAHGIPEDATIRFWRSQNNIESSSAEIPGSAPTPPLTWKKDGGWSHTGPGGYYSLRKTLGQGYGFNPHARQYHIDLKLDEITSPIGIGGINGDEYATLIGPHLMNKAVFDGLREEIAHNIRYNHWQQYEKTQGAPQLGMPQGIQGLLKEYLDIKRMESPTPLKKDPLSDYKYDPNGAIKNSMFNPPARKYTFTGQKDLERILTDPSTSYEKALDKLLKYQQDSKHDYDLTSILNRFLPEELFSEKDIISTFRGTSTDLSRLRPGSIYNRTRRTSTSMSKSKAETFGSSMFGQPMLKFDLDRESRGIDFSSFIPHDLNSYKDELEVLLHPEEYIVKQLSTTPLMNQLTNNGYTSPSVIEITFERLKSIGPARIAQMKKIQADAGNNSDYEQLINLVNDSFHNAPKRSVETTESYSSSMKEIFQNYNAKKITKLQMDLQLQKLKNDLVIPRHANGGYMSIPKFHSGGKVGYKYGGEVMAMLQGGEVVIPKEIVRHYENGGPVSNSNSSQYNINVSVNGSNASADEIAKTVMRTIQNQQNMISGPRYV